MKIKLFLKNVSFHNSVRCHIVPNTQNWIKSIFDTGNESNQAMNNEK